MTTDQNAAIPLPSRYDIEHIKSQTLSVCTGPQAADLLDRIADAKRFLREVEAAAKERMLEIIDEHGTFEHHGIRHYVGKKKTTRCVNVPRAIDCILDASNGDMQVLANTLASQPLKPAATSHILPADTFSELFLTETVPDAKTGKPKREPKSVPVELARRNDND